MKLLKVFIKLIVNAFILITITSCSSFIQSFSTDNVALKKRVEIPGFCGNRSAQQSLVASDKQSVKAFSDFLHLVRKDRTLNRRQIIVAWSLFQMNQRPDLATPSSRLQILTKSNNEIQFWDFKDSSLEMDIPKSSPPMTFLYGLETILRIHSPKRSLMQIAKLLDKYLPPKIPISLDFATFISDNQDKLQKNKIFSKNFFKAGEQLHYGESIAKINYTSLIKNYYKLRKKVSNEVITSNQLFSYELPGKQINALCNIDIKQYEQNKFNIRPTEKERHHPFAISFPDGDFFLAITSISNRNYKPLFNSYLIETSQDKIIAPLCYSLTPQGAYVYLSFKGRDPAQHLYNLFQYKIHDSKSPDELDQFLKFPRHIFLKNPMRLLYESGRSSKKGLDQFLSKDIPVYHSNALGEVWIYSPKSGFIVDDRGKASLSCMK